VKTTLSRDHLVELGSRLRVQYLIEQARYTLGLVAQDSKVSSVAAPVAAEAQAALAALEGAWRDRAVAAANARSATERQDAQLASAMAWREAFVGPASAARRQGLPMPEGAVRTATRSHNPIAVAADVERLVELGVQNLPSLAAVRASSDLLKRGSAVAAALREADASQELARRNATPEAVRRMRELAAKVHLAVATLNAIAHHVHEGDRSRASQYHMKVLHRRSSPPATADPAA
jgi:hypothetical protein